MAVAGLACALPVSAQPVGVADGSDPAPPPPLAAATAEPPKTPRPPPPPPPLETKAAGRPEPDAVQPKPVEVKGLRGARVHDGFYLRFGLGANYGRSLVQTNRVSKPDVRIVGMGRAVDVWAGITIPNGIVLGLNLSATDVSSDGADIGNGDSAAANSWAFQLGGFLDAYPNVRDGYHFGGAISVAAVTAHADAVADQVESKYKGGGLGVSVFAGYDAWVGSQLSIGGLLRLGGAITRDSTDEHGPDVTKQGTAYGAQVLATILYQ